MIIKSAEFVASYGTREQLPASGRTEIVFAGRSNVGKSSLINRLCNRKNLARVSSRPGKTANINFYSVNDFYIVDLPGYGFAKVSKTERTRWDSLIRGYFTSGRNIGLVLRLIDCRRPPTEDDILLMKYLSRLHLPFDVVLTKSDKLNKSSVSGFRDEFYSYCAPYHPGEVIVTSAEKNTGIDTLGNTLRKVLDSKNGL